MGKRLLYKPEDLGSNPGTGMKRLKWLAVTPVLNRHYMGDQDVVVTWLSLCSVCGVVLQAPPGHAALCPLGLGSPCTQGTRDLAKITWRVRRCPGSKVKASMQSAGDYVLCVLLRDGGKNWQMCIILIGMVWPRSWRLTYSTSHQNRIFQSHD